MKKHVIFSAFIALTVLFSSCTKEDEAKVPVEPANPFKASVDGAAWASTTATATYRYGIFMLTGKAADGSMIVIRVRPMAGLETIAPYRFMYNDNDNVGVYMVKETDTTSFITSLVDWSASYEPKLTFTTFNTSSKNAIGTFDMKVKRPTDNKIIIITGSFNVTFDDKIPPTPTKTMTAKVDGVSWIALNVMGISSSMTNTLQVVGNSSGGTSIGLTIPYNVAAGTYTVSEFGSYMAQYNPTSTTWLSGKSGTIVITSHDMDAEVIKGTFSFSASDGTTTKAVSEGNFVCVY